MWLWQFGLETFHSFGKSPNFSTVIVSGILLESSWVLPIRNIKRVTTIFQFVEFTAAINCIPNDEIKRDCQFGIQKNVLLLRLSLFFPIQTVEPHMGLMRDKIPNYRLWSNCLKGSYYSRGNIWISDAWQSLSTAKRKTTLRGKTGLKKIISVSRDK